MAENCGLFTRDAQAYLSAPAAMTTGQLSERLYTVTDGNVRTLFVEGERSVIAFDTFGTPGRARSYARAIAAALPDKPIGTIIYTHDHLDHAGFAADLAPGVDIVADELCAKVIKLRGAQGQLQPTRVLTGTLNELTIDGV